MLSSRKRKRPFDSYVDHLERDPTEFERRKQFLVELQLFYRKKWSVPIKIPHVNGCSIDVYQLSQKVISLGGWQKVSVAGRWGEVSSAIGVDVAETLVTEHAIKLLYMRYLSKFESVLGGGDGVDFDDDYGGAGESSRSGKGTRSSTRGKAYMSAMWSIGGGQGGTSGECPYSRGSFIPPSHRSFGYNAAPGADAAPDADEGRNRYERVVRSLLSGLPNEVDFALNVCTLLSHPGPRFMHLRHSPQLVTCLLAHAGIFGDDELGVSLRALYDTDWLAKTQRRFVHFWRQGVTDPAVRRLLHATPAASSLSKSSAGALKDEGDGQTEHVDDGGSAAALLNGVREEYDLKSPVSWRVYQVTSILRNLSFEAVNRAPLAASRPLIKFLFVCIHSRWPSLQSMALDIMSNVAPEILLESLEEGTVELLFRTLSASLHSEDKLHVIRALEIVGGICQNEKNLLRLSSLLDAPLLRRVLDLITVCDIMLCVYALECLYQVSELGTPSARLVVTATRAIEVLVNLTTVEAVSFGRHGLSGMKVVEFHGGPTPAPQTIGGGMYLPPLSSQPPSAVPVGIMPRPQQPMPNVGHVVPPPIQMNQAGPGLQPNAHLIQQHQQMMMRSSFVGARLSAGAPPGVVGPASTPSFAQPPPPMQVSSAPVDYRSPAVPAAMPPPSSTAMPQPLPASAPMQQQQMQPTAPTAALPTTGPAIVMQQDEQVELLTTQWLKRSLTLDEPTSTVSRGQLYAAYVDEMRTRHASLAVSVHTFTQLMKGLFPSCVLRKVPSERAQLMQVEGIRFRHPRAFPTGGSSVPTPTNGGPSVGLPSPHNPPPTAQVVNGGGSQQQSVLQKILTSSSTPNPLTIIRPLPPSGVNHVSTAVDVPSQPMISSHPTVGATKYPHASPPMSNGISDELSRGATSSTPDSLTSSCSSDDAVDSGPPLSATMGPPSQPVAGFFRAGVREVKAAPCGKESMQTRLSSQDAVQAVAPIVNGLPGSNNGRNGMVRPVAGRFVDTGTKPRENGEPMTGLAATTRANGVVSPATTVDSATNTDTGVEPQDAQDTKTSPSGVSSTRRLVAAVRATRPNTRSTTTNGKVKRPLHHAAAAGTRTRKNDGDSDDDGDDQTQHPCTSTAYQPPTSSQMPGMQQQSSQMPPPQQPSFQLRYMCEWNGCGRLFPRAQAVGYHCYRDHIDETVTVCRWPACDQTVRLKWSLVTHVQDNHCSEAVLRAAAIRRHELAVRGVTTVPEPHKPAAHPGYSKHAAIEAIRRHAYANLTKELTVVGDNHCSEAVLRAAAIRRHELAVRGVTTVPEPRKPAAHPGYSKHAAIEAIRRHAYANLTKELTDESEGPVTKSIRLTSCLILRNLARHSREARRHLVAHEAALSRLALSRLEGATALAQCLMELADDDEECEAPEQENDDDEDVIGATANAPEAATEMMET